MNSPRTHDLIHLPCSEPCASHRPRQLLPQEGQCQLSLLGIVVPAFEHSPHWPLFRRRPWGCTTCWRSWPCAREWTSSCSASTATSLRSRSWALPPTSLRGDAQDEPPPPGPCPSSTHAPSTRTLFSRALSIHISLRGPPQYSTVQYRCKECPEWGCCTASLESLSPLPLCACVYPYAQVGAAPLLSALAEALRPAGRHRVSDSPPDQGPTLLPAAPSSPTLATTRIQAQHGTTQHNTARVELLAEGVWGSVPLSGWQGRGTCLSSSPLLAWVLAWAFS